MLPLATASAVVSVVYSDATVKKVISLGLRCEVSDGLLFATVMIL